MFAADSFADDPVTLRAPYVVVDDFLPINVATAMRLDIDAHFAEPGRHRFGFAHWKRC